MPVVIKIKRDRDGAIAAVESCGHAGFSGHGTDIVCAAVSALLQTAVLGVESVTGSDDFYRCSEGYLFFESPVVSCEKNRANIAFLLETICKALLEIRKQYPSYIRIEEGSSSGRKNKINRLNK